MFFICFTLWVGSYILVGGNTKLSHDEAEESFFPSPSQTLAEPKCFKTSPDCYSPHNASQVQVSRLGKVTQETRLLVIRH